VTPKPLLKPGYQKVTVRIAEENVTRFNQLVQAGALSHITDSNTTAADLLSALLGRAISERAGRELIETGGAE
jgi:hypothetical protein